MKLRYTLILLSAVLLLGLGATFLVWNYDQELSTYAEYDLWKDVDLPIAVDAHWISGSAKSVSVTITTNDLLRVNGRQIPKSELKKKLVSKFKKYGEYPVRIFADRDLPMKEVWQVIQLCREEVGLWRFNIVAVTDDTPRVPVLGSIAFHNPIKKGSKRYKGTVAFEEDVEDLLNIMIIKDSIVLAGRRISQETLERQLLRVSRYSVDVSIMITVAEEVVCQDLVTVLNICSKCRFHNINVMQVDNSDRICCEIEAGI